MSTREPRQSVIDATARRLEEAKQEIRRWGEEQIAKIDGLTKTREMLAKEPTLPNLLTHLQSVRQLDRRPLLIERQISLIPSDSELTQVLCSISAHPLTFGAGEWKDDMVKHMSGEEEEMVLDASEDDAQFYRKQLAYASHDALSNDLDKVQALKPHYEYVIAPVRAFSESLPPGPRILGYDGFTMQ